MAKQVETVSSQTVKMSDIKADHAFNVRVNVENLKPHPVSIDDEGRACCTIHGVQYLAKDIERNGLMTPLIVRQTGKDKYQLIAGFRRYQAVKLLKWPQVAVQVRTDMGDEQAYLLNLLENTSRENLTPYEIASRCDLLKKQFGWDGPAIAGKLNKTKSYVNNLMRTYQNLHPDILKAWRNGDEGTNMTKLTKLAALDKKEQLANWQGQASTAGTPSTGTGEAVKKSRSRDTLVFAIEAAKKTAFNLKGVSVKDAVIAALMFAAGDEDLILGVGGFKPETKLPKEAKEAEILLAELGEEGEADIAE